MTAATSRKSWIWPWADLPTRALSTWSRASTTAPRWTTWKMAAAPWKCAP